MMYFQVLVGFVVLTGAAEVLVRGAVSLADRMGVSPLVIGMTVVAVGTSAPELVVSLDAALAGAPGLAVGNIVGSNIANVILILGVTCLVKPIVDGTAALKRDAAILMGGGLLFAGLCLRGELDLIAGIVLLVGFFTFLGVSYWRDSNDPEAAEEIIHEVEELEGKPKSLPVTLALVIAGLAGLAFGADILVDGGVAIAREFGISEEVIGLTVFAFGTSLPELAASVVAAMRGHSDIAIGNVVGSNLFNVLGVGGTAAVVVTLPVAPQILSFDLWVMLAASAFLLPVMVMGWRLTRAGAVIFLILYGAYIWAQAYGVEQLLGRTV